MKPTPCSAITGMLAATLALLPSIRAAEPTAAQQGTPATKTAVAGLQTEFRKLGQKWFWKEGFRSGDPKGLMEHRTKACARNSNFLLNVGPDRNGKIIESSLRALAEIGKATENPK